MCLCRVRCSICWEEGADTKASSGWSYAHKVQHGAGKSAKTDQVRSMHMRSADQNIQFSQASDSASALQAQNAELQFYDKLHAHRPDQQAWVMWGEYAILRPQGWCNTATMSWPSNSVSWQFGQLTCSIHAWRHQCGDRHQLLSPQTLVTCLLCLCPCVYASPVYLYVCALSCFSYAYDPCCC